MSSNFSKAFIKYMTESYYDEMDLSLEDAIEIVRKEAEKQNVPELIDLIDQEQNSIVENKDDVMINRNFIRKHPLKFGIRMFVLLYLISAGLGIHLRVLNKWLDKNDITISKIISKVKAAKPENKQQVLKNECKSFSCKIAQQYEDGTITKLATDVKDHL